MTAEDSHELRADGETTWEVVVEGFDPLTERGAEAVLSVANGYFGVRAALEEGNPASNPMVVVAGVYVPTKSPAQQTLLELPDPSSFDVTVDGRPLQMSSVRTVEHVRQIDLRRGTSMRTWSFVDGEGRSWRWESLRAASATQKECYFHQLRLALEEGDAPVKVVLSLPRGAILTSRRRDHETQMLVARDARTPQLLRAMALVHGGQTNIVDGSITALVEPDRPLTMNSVSRIMGSDGNEEKGECRFERLFIDHKRTWKERWKVANLQVDGNPRLEQAVRFAAYHLISSAAVSEGRASIGPRNLSGSGYHGHIFWDTEIFILPFLSLVWPRAARACLLYRHRTLNAARHRARSYGYEGALYAWESTDTGEERTPDYAFLPNGSAIRILNGEQENHISADVPYAVIQYWRATGDDAFMLRYGAEILFECARFWCSRVSPADQGCCSIRRVIGPNEYHESVDNNAYTNAMARWTLIQAWAYAEEMERKSPEGAKALLRRLGIKPGEHYEWRQVAETICRSSFQEDEVVEQFDGFFGLEEVDVASYRRAGIPLDIAVGHEAVQRMRVVKQADVLMALCLAPEMWSEAAARRNMAYYEPLTAHTSSLSPPVHALLAAWLRDDALCQAYLDQTIDIDLGDSYRRAASGVHTGALGGLWQAVVFGLGGLKYSADRLEFDPFLPTSVRGLSFAVNWRGRRVDVRISDRQSVDIKVKGPPCEIRVNQERRVVKPGRYEPFQFDSAATYWSARGGEGDADD